MERSYKRKKMIKKNSYGKGMDIFVNRCPLLIMGTKRYSMVGFDMQSLTGYLNLLTYSPCHCRELQN